MDCEYCGPVCYGGAAHNARVEDNAKYAPVSGASPDSKARRREDMLGRLNRAEFGSADQQAVWELLEDYAALTAEQEIQRLGDLVRYARHFLHDNGLVSNEEFAALVADAEDGKRVARLGAYDAARQEIERLRKALARYKDVQDGHGIYSAGAVLDPRGWQRSRAAEEERRGIIMGDLSMLIRMMVTKHRRGKLDEEYCLKALDYLERKGLQGNLLRANDAQEE